MNANDRYVVIGTLKRSAFAICKTLVGRRAADRDAKWLRARGWRVRVRKLPRAA